MNRPVEITTPFPTVEETAKRLGLSKREMKLATEIFERLQKNGSQSGKTGRTTERRRSGTASARRTPR